MARNVSPYTVAEESLLMSSAARGQQGMQSTSAPLGPNSYDGGGSSKAAVNTQPFNNERLALQNVEQNIVSAVPQAESDAMGKVRGTIGQESEAQYKAQEFANDRMAQMLYANESGNAMMELNGIMQSPDKAKFLNHIATGKTMAMGLNPDLGAAKAQTEQYS